MVNYEKIEECYKRENYLYDKPPDYIGKQNWLQKVTNPNTGTFYRISDLPIEEKKQGRETLSYQTSKSDNQNKNRRWKRMAQIKTTMVCNR
jgi:hypothetical protein